MLFIRPLPMQASRSTLLRAVRFAASLALCGACGGTTVASNPDADSGADGVIPDAGSNVVDAAAGDSADGGDAGGFDWDLPEGFPRPKVPDDNPMSEAKVELGRLLFYDTRLSANRTQSCASCHRQELAFTDGRAVGLGSTGEEHIRGSMGLANVAYTSTLTWANPVVRDLERQALVPLFGEDPVELGLVGMEAVLVQRLSDEPRYEGRFSEAFSGSEDALSIDHVTKALAAFQRTIISGDTPYDRYQAGDRGALDDSARRGMELFFSERAECFHCHSGFNFSDSVTHEGKAFDEVAFHNTGLYNVGRRGGYPEGNEGLYAFTGDVRDIGRFKAPSLRNVALTAPYMHDGSIASLDGVLDHYAAGGRTIKDGPNAGVGSLNPNKSEFVVGFEITQQERADLIVFLNSLTDDALLNDPRFSDPWKP